LGGGSQERDDDNDDGHDKDNDDDDGDGDDSDDCPNVDRRRWDRQEGGCTCVRWGRGWGREF
jgi:hypothetical protein